jgi:SAM-dependent methyltransferase
MTDYVALTERQKAVWSAGDWPTVAPTIAGASEAMVEHLAPGSGDVYLDVATGDGIAAVLAAQRGATVTGLDLVPALVDAAKARAAAAGVDATFVVGDAQQLPFEDDSFDFVSSCFGAMFAPDQQRAADELVRVCRPGGKVAVAAWTPEGLNGQMFATLGKYLPPPPEGFQPPLLWGTEERVNELFAGQDVSTERIVLHMEDASLEAVVERMENSLGPTVMARKLLEPEGRWPAARDDLLAMYSRFNEAEGGAYSGAAEYLRTTVSVS